MAPKVRGTRRGLWRQVDELQASADDVQSDDHLSTFIGSLPNIEGLVDQDSAILKEYVEATPEVDAGS